MQLYAFCASVLLYGFSVLGDNLNNIVGAALLARPINLIPSVCLRCLSCSFSIASILIACLPSSAHRCLPRPYISFLSSCVYLKVSASLTRPAASLSWEAFEQYSLWQILRAEIGGRAPVIERFAPAFLGHLNPEGMDDDGDGDDGGCGDMMRTLKMKVRWMGVMIMMIPTMTISI